MSLRAAFESLRLYIWDDVVPGSTLEAKLHQLELEVQAAEREMRPLTTEMHRVLEKRIAKAIDKARYYPADPAVIDHHAAAAEVLRPYAPR